MDEEPDFYMYGGDGNLDFNVLRACRKLNWCGCNGRKILLTTIDPPIEAGVLSEGAKLDIIGLTDRSTWYPLETLQPGELTGAVLWEVRDIKGDNCVALPNIGVAVIYKDKPIIDAAGHVSRSRRPPRASIVRSVIAALIIQAKSKPK